eukprot:m.70164 g.70164  ORF g.70164 m.70164 type:complete len:965 (-) comp13765_c0_seq1:100-2994(-)
MDKVIADMEAGKADILKAVQDLGPYLTSTETNTRTKSTQILADLVQHASSTQLSSSGPVVMQFFCDRMDDLPSTIPCLKGLLALANSSTFTKENAVIVTKAVFDKLVVQAQALTTRELVFRLMSILLDKFGAYLSRTMGEQFVLGFLQQYDGEKDPRCLVIVFELIPFVASTFPIAKYADDMFETSSCYFPITFTPPPNDPYGVTKEQLVQGLRNCMSASPLFAQPCFELLFDKVTSTIDDTKVDSFETIAQCAKHFGFEVIQNYFSTAYSHIRRELFENLEPKVHQAALSAFASLCNLIPTREEAATALDSLLAEANHHLTDIDSNSITTHGKLLIAATGSCAFAVDLIFSQFVPTAASTFIKTDDNNKRMSIGGVLAGLCQAAFACSGKAEMALVASHVSVAKTPLVAFVEETFVSGTDHLQAIGMRAMLALASLQLLQEDELRNLLDTALTLCSRTSYSLTREALAQGGQAFAAANPTAVDHALATLLPSLSSAVDAREFAEQLKIIEALSLNSVAGAAVVTALLSALYELDGQDVNSVRKGHATAAAIKHMLIHGPQEMAGLLIEHALDVTKNTLVAVVEKSKPFFTLDARTASDLGLGVCRACEKLHLEARMELIERCAAAFCTPSAHSLMIRAASVTGLSTLLWIVPAICGGLPRDQSLELDHVAATECLAASLTVSSSWDDAVATSSTYAALLNKAESFSESSQSIKQQQLFAITNPIQDVLDGKSSSCAAGVLCIFAYSTKALVMCADTQARRFVDLLFAMLRHPQLDQAACRAVQVILQQDDVVLNRESQAKFKLMFRQRFFQEHVPRLVQLFQETPNPVYLKALAFLLKGVPMQVVFTELPTVLPLLLKSLDLDDSELLIGTLDMLHALAQDAPTQLAEHVNTVIDRSLRLKSHNRMDVRKAALELLANLVQLPTHVVVPYKTQVLRGLAPSLDDRKRIVRTAAVQASSAWFVL